MKTDFCTLPSGEKIFYRETGAGEHTLLLLHGNLSSSYFFEPFLPHIKGCRVIAADMRGYGNSSYNTPFTSLLDLAEDFSQFCDVLGLTSIYAGGWSTGGAVSMELAAIRPDLVKGLVLISSVSCKGFTIPPKDEAGQPIPGTAYESRAAFVKDPLVSAIRIAIENRDMATLRSIWDTMIFTKYKPSEEAYAIYLDEMCKQRSSDDAYWALVNFNMTKEPTDMAEGSGHMDLIRCPVLAFHGDEDLVLPLSQAEAIKACLGDQMEFHLLDNCSHASYIDYAEPMGARISAFLDEQ